MGLVEKAQASSQRLDASEVAKRLVDLLDPKDGVTSDSAQKLGIDQPLSLREIISSINEILSRLNTETPILASFHDGQIHDPLGGGSYAFQADLIGPILDALSHDELLWGESLSGTREGNDRPSLTDHPSMKCSDRNFPTHDVIIHAGLQPNNSPHIGTIIVFCYAFLLAQKLRRRMLNLSTEINSSSTPSISVEITFVDTAPVSNQGIHVNGLDYQRSFRDTPAALSRHLGDYMHIFDLLSQWSGIPYVTKSQSDFFSHPAMPSLIQYLARHHHLLGRQLSPKHGVLALRAACPVPGCGLAEKHGLLNEFENDSITFHCPDHGPHKLSTSRIDDIARLEANAPVRNLLRSMAHLTDVDRHHIRITGSDYAGSYQEMFLYRPLAAWSAETGIARGQTPHIFYAPLVVDWSGAKLSKSLYVREGGYESMALLGSDALCSFGQLKAKFDDDGFEGLSRVWREVEGWINDPKKLFRTFSVDYLRRRILEGSDID